MGGKGQICVGEKKKKKKKKSRYMYTNRNDR